MPASASEVKMVNLTVNGQAVNVPEEATVLDAIRAAGAELPKLCHHDGLTPTGVCRLCMVAVTEPDQGLIAACAHPVEEGMVLETDAPEAAAARRMVLEFLLSRCPQSDLIQEMAANAGLTESRFGDPEPEDADELCVLCGLCVRVCREAIGANAISFIGRGMDRKVGSPFEVNSESCIGCGACAEICPTGAVKIEDRGNQRILHTWNTTIELQACPECGNFFAPEPMDFIKDMLPEAAETWSRCPECRRRITARKWLAGSR
jgi:NADH dehydrogenase/NADH:ubiquinone oxidoreductase subunit G